MPRILCEIQPVHIENIRIYEEQQETTKVIHGVTICTDGLIEKQVNKREETDTGFF